MFEVRPWLPHTEIERRINIMVNNIHTGDCDMYPQRYDNALRYGYSRGREAQIYALLTHEENLWLLETDMLLYNELGAGKD